MAFESSWSNNWAIDNSSLLLTSTRSDIGNRRGWITPGLLDLEQLIAFVRGQEPRTLGDRGLRATMVGIPHKAE